MKAIEGLPHQVVHDRFGYPEVHDANGWLLGYPVMVQGPSIQEELAHLWAAAPDLATALLDVVTKLKVDGAPCADPACSKCVAYVTVLAKARLALAKAGVMVSEEEGDGDTDTGSGDPESGAAAPGPGVGDPAVGAEAGEGDTPRPV